MSLSELYKGCRTYRRFTQKPVPEELLHTLVDTAHTRSCGRNGQPLRFIVVKSPEKVAAMQPLVRWAAALPKAIGTSVQGEQPTAFVVVLRENNAGPLTNVDLGIALDTMAICAWEQGVGSCIMAAVDRKAIGELLSVPEGWEVNIVLALGYPSHQSTLVEAQEGGSLDYYVDEKRDYYVPKLKLKDVARFC